MTVTLEVILGILTIVQFGIGAIAWYLGMQIKLLRAELVHRDACQLRHAEIDKSLLRVLSRLERVEAVEEIKDRRDA